MIELIAVFGGGLLLGLAGSLHCACMCGGIASGYLLIVQPKTAGGQLLALLHVQGWRIAIFAVFGALLAGTMSVVIVPIGVETAARILPWVSAAIVMATGLTMAGLFPVPAFAGRAFAALRPSRFDVVLAPMRRHPRLMPVAMGAAWAVTPCPMVFAALFSAALTGSSWNAALWMIGFGVGTLPAVATAALGVHSVYRFSRSKSAEVAGGLLIVTFGFLIAYSGWPQSAILCAIR